MRGAIHVDDMDAVGETQSMGSTLVDCDMDAMDEP